PGAGLPAHRPGRAVARRHRRTAAGVDGGCDDRVHRGTRAAARGSADGQFHVSARTRRPTGEPVLRLGSLLAVPVRRRTALVCVALLLLLALVAVATLSL